MAEELTNAAGRSALDTKERILIVAEQLFAEHGFEAVSLRAITTEAEANVAAVNYHFGGKQELVAEVILKHMLPVNEARMRGLEELIQKGQPTAREVLDAFFRPFVTHVMQSEQCERLLMKFMARAVDSSDDILPGSIKPELQKVIRAFVEVLQQCLPHLSERDAFCRMHFTFGCFVNSMLHNDMLSQISGDRVEVMGMEQLLDEVLSFCTAGMERCKTKGGKK